MPPTSTAVDQAAADASPAVSPAVPPWLTPQLLTAALREEDGACAAVTTIKVRPATGTNENYLSELFRVQAHLGKSGVRRLIVKAVPSGEAAGAMVQALGFFERETRMLRNTLPRLQRCLAAGLSHRPPSHLQIGPRTIHTCPNGSLVMEDLAARGFCNVSRREGLDLPHSLVAVRVLARMHAASVVLHSRGGEVARELEAYGQGWTGEGLVDTYRTLITVSLQTLATAVRPWPRLGETVAAKLERAATTAPQRAVEAAKSKPGDFVVLCHGDAWSNNIMFTYDEESAQVRAAILVDFQMVSWGSPSLDLHYFLALAVSPAVHRESSGRVVRAYHNELVACLAAMGWPGVPPSLAALQKDMRAREAWAFGATTALLPIRYVEAGVNMDSQAMLIKDNPSRIASCNTPEARAVLEERLPVFMEKGFLD